MKRSRAPTGRVVELSTLAVEQLWRLTCEPLLSTTFVPQADDLEVVYSLARNRLPEVISSLDLAKAFGLHGRHAAYTLEAATEVGLLSRFSTGWFVRSAFGEKVSSVSEAEGYRLFITAILRLPVIRRVLSELRASSSRRVSKATVQGLVATSSGGRYTRSTIGRRANTVVSWMLWLENNVWFASAS